MIYLDHAATTRTDPAVAEEMTKWQTELYMNPSAFYQPAVRVRMKIDEARRKIAGFLNVNPAGIYFTSGGTESDNWAIRSAVEANSAKGRHIITSSVEHPAVRNTMRYLETKGFEVTKLPVDKYGSISAEDLKKVIRDDTVLVSIMHANNELGTIEPLEEIGEITAERGVLFHTDAVQTFGHIPINVEKCRIDLLSASAHKLYGPKGIGLLYINPGIKFGSMLFGGRQEKGLRPGTENVSSIIGFAKAVEIASNRMEEDAKRESALRDKFEEALINNIPKIKINSGASARLPGIINLTFPGIEAEPLLILLDSNGICASAGSACSAGAIEASHVLLSAGLTNEEAKRTIRFSLGRENTDENIEKTVKLLKEIFIEKEEHR